jgi:hypothetical protein
LLGAVAVTASDSPQRRLRALSVLTAAELDRAGQLLVVRGVDRAAAEALFRDAVAAVYFADVNEVRVLRSLPAGSAGMLMLPQSDAARDTAAETGAAEASASTLREFVAALEADVAAGSGSARAFIAKAPVSLPAPAGIELQSASATIATGLGARIDDITITTDAPAFLTCGASVAPPSGKAPLQVALTPTVGGASAAAQYYWAFDDGFDSTATAPTHRYVLPGQYFPTLFVSDGNTQC